jgi:hypothetical protein
MEQNRWGGIVWDETEQEERRILGWNRTEEEAQFRMEQNRRRGIVQDGTAQEERDNLGW